MKYLILFFCLSILPVHALILEQLLVEGTLAETVEHTKIGYYIGSFDPLHIGHQDIVHNILRAKLCDYIIVYPSWGGDDHYKKRIDVQYRLHMLHTVFADHPHVIVTRLPPYEFQRVLTSECSQSGIFEGEELSLVVPKHAGTKFIGILGSDSALALGKIMEDKERDEKRRQHLDIFMRGIKIPPRYICHSLGGIMALPVASFIVAKRAGDDLSVLHSWIDDRPIIAYIEGNYQALSSTQVKQVLSNSGAVEGMLHPDVLSFVQAEKLYNAP